MSETALRMTVTRMRHRVSELFRLEVGLTMGQSAEVEEELRGLLSCLST